MPQFVLFVLGLCVGSFLNVVIDRIPRGESIIKRRSYCEYCDRTLSIWDLIPVFSYLFLGGKCRYCKKDLSLYYLLVELITGVVFIITYFYIISLPISQDHEFILQLFYHLYVFSSLIAIFFADIKYGIIPNKILYPLAVVVISFLFMNDFIFNRAIFIDHIFSGLGAFLFFVSLFVITKGAGMGFGDVKLSLVLGLLLGYPSIVFALYLAFLTGAGASLILVLWGKKKFFGGTIPFGPFLVCGAFLSIFTTPFLTSVLTFFIPILP